MNRNYNPSLDWVHQFSFTNNRALFHLVWLRSLVWKHLKGLLQNVLLKKDIYARGQRGDQKNLKEEEFERDRDFCLFIILYHYFSHWQNKKTIFNKDMK